MAQRRVLVFEGQSIFDVIIQEYGDIANTFDFMAENPNLTLNTNLTAGEYVKVDTEEKGVSDVKDKIRQENFKVVNSQQIDSETALGDFNNDFNNDYLT